MIQKCHFNKKLRLCSLSPAFSLAETAAALLILAVICTSVVVVFNDASKSAANSARRIEAFEVAQENMEKLLASTYVQEGIEYGQSVKYPGIEWQSGVETFYEPITKRMWARAVCTASYLDIDLVSQKVELTNWLTDLTQDQVLELIKRKQAQKNLLAQADKILGSIEEAAEYSTVPESTIQQWVDNGMPVTEDGLFIKDYLDLYKKYGGNPPGDQKAQLDNIFNPILMEDSQSSKPDTSKPTEQSKQPDKQKPQKIICGKTVEELKSMPRDEFFKWLMSCPEVFSGR
jgi:hypothetical protein